MNSQWRFGVWLAAFLAVLALAPARPPAEGRSGLLLVVNKADQSLSLIDPTAGAEVSRVKLSGFTGHEVAASPDGNYAYVPIYGNSGAGRPGTDGSKLDVIDVGARKLVRTVDLGAPVRPHCAKFAPDGSLYVSAELENSLDVLDPKTFKTVAQVPTGRTLSHMFVISKDGKHAYTSNIDSGSVSVLDLARRETEAVIAVAETTQRISFSADEKLLFTADQKAPRLAVIDVEAKKFADWIALPAVGFGTAPTPDGRSLLVALPASSGVAVVDLKTRKVSRTIPVPAAPQEILVAPDGRTAFVSCSKDGEVAVLSLETWTVLKVIKAGADADGLAWAGR